jgi:Cu(I)/Ag(I) efflux system membrane fusion protein
MVDVNLKVEGWIKQLFLTSNGQFVRKGAPLFSLESTTLQTTQLEYVQALKKRDQAKSSDVPDYSDRVREKLAFLDMPSDQVKALEAAGRPLPAVVFRAPSDGWVMDLQAVRGMRVVPGETICRILDLATVWVEADLRELDRGLVHEGSRATVTVDAFPGERFNARVVSVVDERSRTTKLRLELPNPGGRINPGMNATVLLTAQLGAGLVVPRDAVLDSGSQQTVFIARGNGHFEPRTVTVGHRTDDSIQILSGLQAGEQVAIGANFLLDSESQLQSALAHFSTDEPTPPSPTAAAGELSVTMETTPNPPRTGDIAIEVMARTPDGRSLTDGEVQVIFSMPAMPSMNMPAMRTEARLTAGTDGLFRGNGHLSMAGRWDVAVKALSRSGVSGMAHLSLVAQ